MGVMSSTNEKTVRRRFFLCLRTARKPRTTKMDCWATARPRHPSGKLPTPLRVFAAVDVVEVDGVELPLMRAGARYAQVEGVANIEQIMAALTREA